MSITNITWTGSWSNPDLRSTGLELVCILYTKIQFLPHNEHNVISFRNTNQWMPCKEIIVFMWESCVSQHILWAKMQCCSVKSVYTYKYTNSLLSNITSGCVFAVLCHKSYKRFAVLLTLTRVLGSHRLSGICSWNYTCTVFIFIIVCGSEAWLGALYAKSGQTNADMRIPLRISLRKEK
jgi:hypothetical protein